VSCPRVRRPYRVSRGASPPERGIRANEALTAPAVEFGRLLLPCVRRVSSAHSRSVTLPLQRQSGKQGGCAPPTEISRSHGKASEKRFSPAVPTSGLVIAHLGLLGRSMRAPESSGHCGTRVLWWRPPACLAVGNLSFQVLLEHLEPPRSARWFPTPLGPGRPNPGFGRKPRRCVRSS